VKLILAGGTRAIRQRAVGGDRQNTVADRTLADSLEVQGDVFAEKRQGIGYTPALLGVSGGERVRGIMIPGS